MTPRRRRGQPSQNEAARLAQVLLDAGYTKRDIGQIIGRNPSLVSQFFTKGKGASYVEGLRAAVQEQQVGAATTVDELTTVAQPHIGRRQTRGGKKARVRGKDIVATPGNSSMARAGRQHISSGASRLRPVVENTAAAPGGRIAFTIRARKSDYLIDSGRRGDSPGVKRGVVQRRDGTEERSYGAANAPMGTSGFDAQEWKSKVDAAGGDVAKAVRDWMVSTGRLKEDAKITNIEVRGWAEQ
jgi:hypothetical protein